MPTIRTKFSAAEIAYGSPRRVNRDEFELRDVLGAYSIGNKFVAEKKQVDFFKTACEANPGWIMFVNCKNDLETGRLIAANIAGAYLEQRMRFVWQNLGNNETVKAVNDTVNLLVIDALFEDSPAFRRDRVYDLITYVHDNPHTSIIVITKSKHPEYMAKVIGIRPNFALMVEQ